jgi:hypothetical protein
MNTQYAGYFRADKIDSLRHNLPDSGRGSDYILSINPNFSDSPNSDDFSMCLVRPAGNKILVIDTYAKHDVPIEDHLLQLRYYLESYKIKLIIENLTNWNSLSFVPFARKLSICNELTFPETVGAVASEDNIRTMNEILQMAIDRQSILFATPKDEAAIRNLHMLKEQLKLIEVTANALGSMTWNLPMEYRSGRDRKRKDLYEALLMAVWGVSGKTQKEVAV